MQCNSFRAVFEPKGKHFSKIVLLCKNCDLTKHKYGVQPQPSGSALEDPTARRARSLHGRCVIARARMPVLDLPRVRACELTYARFLRDFALEGQPFILEDAQLASQAHGGVHHGWRSSSSTWTAHCTMCIACDARQLTCRTALRAMRCALRAYTRCAGTCSVEVRTRCEQHMHCSSYLSSGKQTGIPMHVQGQ